MAMLKPENRTEAPDLQRVEALRQRLSEDPRSLAFVSLAEELNRVGEHAEAATVAQRGLLTHPDSVAGRLALAVAEAEQDHVKEALEQIKRALIIDQENPKALALMGRILLKRGLAKRAVQFLSHAVKLAPADTSYGQLLQEARRQASGQPDQPPAPPVFTADAVPAQGDPWNDGDGGEPGVDHTVFDPDALKRPNRSATGLRAADNPLAGLGSPDQKPGEEPTAYQHPLPNGPRKAKMGGSAAEYSQMMRRSNFPDLPIDVVDSEVERTVSAAQAPAIGGGPKGPPPPPPADGAPANSMPIAPSEAQRAPSVPPAPSAGRSAVQPARPSDDLPKAPSVAREAAEAESRSTASKLSADPGAAAAERIKKNAKAKTTSRQGEPASGQPDKRVGPAATRMVDDALWVLFGKKSASDVGPAAAPPSEEPAEDDKKAPVRARLRGRATPGEAAPGHQPPIVRTSERFGTWAQVATMTVLSVSGAFMGHWIMLSSAGPGPEVASEEVKGLASDLERGGLASLLVAEEKANALARSAPDLQSLLDGVKAEVYARRWRSFGRDPVMRNKALDALDALDGRRPTVEHVAGLVALSTTAVQREQLMDALRAFEKEYPDSPKVRVLQAKLHKYAERERPALNSLFEARGRHKHHRSTLLEMARWYQRSGADAAALKIYQQLLARYPLDVEAAIERYVLGQATGADPDEAQAVSLLAGLVRDEDPAVAKDETGRASLAFAIPLFARGQLVEGIEALGEAEAAFEGSADFKMAVAGAYLAVGEYDRAEDLYQRAAKIVPDGFEPLIGAARARFARDAGLKIDLTRVSEKVARRFKAQRGERTGTVRLPLGRLKLMPGRFEVVRFDPDPSIFPEDAYAKAERPEEFDGINLTAQGERLLRQGKHDAAVAKFEASLGARPTPDARIGLGRALLAKGDVDHALRALKVGVARQPDHIMGRLALAKALMAEEQTLDALDVLEPLEQSTVVVPDGLYWLGQLRAERGDYEGAVIPLRTVTDLRPQDVRARLAYGEVLHRLRRIEDAQRVYDEIVQMQLTLPATDSLPPIALMYLGRAMLERAPKRGVALLKRALKHEEVPVEAHFYLGEALIKSRRTRRQGLRELQKYVRIGPDGTLRTTAQRLLRRR